MILQALNSYYQRLSSDKDSGIAPYGYSYQPISFALIIDIKGKLIQAYDLRESTGKKMRPCELLVPVEETRSGKPKLETAKPNFLWDNTGYVLGASGKEKSENDHVTFQAFKRYHFSLCEGITDDGLDAVMSFLRRWDPSKISEKKNYKEIIGSNVVFRLDGENRYIHERPKARKIWLDRLKKTKSEYVAHCLVSGESSSIARIHRKIKGVNGAKTLGAAIVGFNDDAYCSYGKEQSYNAPISEKCVFNYTTALNYLLKNQKRKIQVGDATSVFWTERDSPLENIFGEIMDPGETNESEARRVENYLRAVKAGKCPGELKDDLMKFFILGLAPNEARLAIRFWYSNTIEALNRNIGNHFNALSILKEYDNQKDNPGIWQLLIETAVLRKSENINPLLSGAFMRSILTGGRYPVSILSAVIGRIHADHDINYYRAALIKAVLIRNFGREVPMALNEESTNVAYRLGRLFSVLEKAQEEAIPGANTTIKDRFFSSASTTPRTVFPQLIRLSQHHLGKLEGGSKVYKEQLVQSILNGINEKEGFPAFLKLEDQGMFALGYYHQRKAFFTKKEKAAAEVDE